MKRQSALCTLRHFAPFAAALIVVGAFSPLLSPVRASDLAERAQAEELLETVYMAAENGLAYSGPSEDFYPTGRVEFGTALDVYHRTSDGWLGVRPPQGSFSWVPAGDAYLLPGGRVIEITNANAVSWIGTQLGSAKQYRWQVQLQSGEQLAVMGEAKIEGDDGEPMLWYRIAPPAGEFRWIRDALTSKSPVEKRHAEETAVAEISGGSPSRAMAMDVTTAAHSRPIMQDDVFDDTLPAPAGPRSVREYEEGEIIDGEYFEGEIIDGEIIGGEYFEGDYYGDDYAGEPYYEGEYAGEYYEPNEVGPPIAAPHHHDPFDGWHIVELCDDGFRFPFLERLFAANAANKVEDPLKYDPYNLQTASRGKSQPRAIPPRSVLTSEEFVVDESPRRHRPWRDPRSLRDQRLQGDVGQHTAQAWDDRASLSREYSDTPTALQQRIDSLRAALSQTFGTDSAAASTGRQIPIGNYSSAASSPLQPVPNAAHVDWYGVGQNRDVDYPSLGIDNQELSQLQIELSRIVAQPVEHWNLGPLIAQTQRYIELGTNAIQRGQARLLLERIEEFQAVAARTELAMRSGGAIGASFSTAASASSAPISTADYQTSPSVSADALTGAPAYDATGWLVPVYAAVAGQPPYALTNDSGSIIAYVSGLPGMKLDHHLNQPVGIRGLKGYLPQLQAGHIQAQSISRLR